MCVWYIRWVCNHLSLFNVSFEQWVVVVVVVFIVLSFFILHYTKSFHHAITNTSILASCVVKVVTLGGKQNSHKFINLVLLSVPSPPWIAFWPTCKMNQEYPTKGNANIDLSLFLCLIILLNSTHWHWLLDYFWWPISI